MTAEELWHAVFGRVAPIEIEIGPGRGVYLVALATAQPAHNFLAIERSHSRAVALQAADTVRHLANVRVLEGDATWLASFVIPPNSIDAYHIGFPDPWWKRRHHRRRLFTAEFVTALARTLVAGGQVHVSTDVGDYFALMTRLLATVLAREAAPLGRPVVTQFEQKARARGEVIHSASFRKVG